MLLFLKQFLDLQMLSKAGMRDLLEFPKKQIEETTPREPGTKLKLFNIAESAQFKNAQATLNFVVDEWPYCVA